MDVLQVISDIKEGTNIKDNMTILWAQYEGLIKKIASKYRGIAEYEDLLQEGYIALNRAVFGYDQDNGAKFTTYLYAVVNTSLYTYVGRQTQVSMPANLSGEVGRYSVFLRDYKREFGEEPTKAQKKAFLKLVLKVDPRALKRIEQALEAKTVKSLNEPMTEDGGTLCDILPDSANSYDDVIREQDRIVLHKDLTRALNKLNDRQREAIESGYYNNMTLGKVGEKMGVSRERARQLMQEGFRRIRNTDYEKNLWNYYEVYLSAASCRHVGVNQFNRTWTSEQEYELLRQETIREKQEKERKEREAIKAKRLRLEQEERDRKEKRERENKQWLERQARLLEEDPELAFKEWKEWADKIIAS